MKLIFQFLKIFYIFKEKKYLGSGFELLINDLVKTFCWIASTLLFTEKLEVIDHPTSDPELLNIIITTVSNITRSTIIVAPSKLYIFVFGLMIY